MPTKSINEASISKAIFSVSPCLKMTIVGGLRIIDSNAQTGTTWWNWTANINILRILFMF
jgi:hypothetical protein